MSLRTPCTERTQGRLGLGGQPVPAGLGRVEPEARHQRALVAPRILAGRLAERGGIAFGIENVVGDLERRSERLAVAVERGPLRGVGPAQDGAGLDPEQQQRAGLHGLQAFDLGGAEGRLGALRLEVEGLAAGHAADPGRTGKAQDQRGSDRRVRMGRLVGHYVERIGQQRVAGQDRGGLVERDMGGRAAAPQVVVVHGGQVVVDQRIAMNHLERRTGPERPLALEAERPGGLDHEERPQSFAAPERRIAHRLPQARGPRHLSG